MLWLSTSIAPATWKFALVFDEAIALALKVSVAL